MDTQNSDQKSIFQLLSTKQALGLGFLAAVLLIGTLGCLVLGFYVWKGGGGADGYQAAVGSVNSANSANKSNSINVASNTNQTTPLELYEKIADDLGLDKKTFDACLSSDKNLANIQADQKSASAAGVRGTPASFIIKDGQIKQVQGGAVSYNAMKALIDQELGNSTTAVPAATVEVSGTLALAADDYVFGDSSATITIVTYSDFQCPYCQRFDSTMQQIVKDFSGKVKWVYRNFPLSFHDQAQNAAEAAECAGDQGKFWEYAFKLFENQSSL